MSVAHTVMNPVILGEIHFRRAMETLILMASGKLGRWTMLEIQDKYPGKLNIRAASRDPGNFDIISYSMRAKWKMAHTQ